MAIIIKVGENIIGTAEKLEDIENLERSPNDVCTADFKLETIRFDKLQLTQAFNINKVMAQSQNYPLQITRELEDGNIITYQNAWITAVDTSNDMGDYVEMETLELEAEEKVK